MVENESDNFFMTADDTDRKRLVEQCIARIAEQVALEDSRHGELIKQFLYTGEEDPDDQIFSLSGWDGARAHSNKCKAALRLLFDELSKFLPKEALSIPDVTPEMVRQQIHPMIHGLVQPNWQEIALRELGDRVFVLNHAGAKAALEAEIFTSWLNSAHDVLWLYFDDYGLKPDKVARKREKGIEGQACEYAVVRLSSLKDEDPYKNVIVHEAAHLLHYLKPGHFQLPVRRNQERFVDVDFFHRELFAFACEAYSRVCQNGDRKSRHLSASQMFDKATSFPEESIQEITNLVLATSRSGKGWKVIRDATVIKPIRRPKFTVGRL